MAEMSIGVWGWFGEKNVGDDALMLMLEQCIHDNCPEANITFYGNPEFIQDISKYTVRAVKRTRTVLLNDAIHQDVLIFGPGGIFPTRNRLKIFLVYLATSILKHKKKKVAFIGVGLDDAAFHSSLCRFFLKKTIRKLDAKTIRYDYRANQQQSQVLSSSVISADLMFLESSSVPTNCQKKYVAVALADIFDGDHSEKTRFIFGIAKLINMVLERGYEIHFVPFTNTKDFFFHEEVIDTLGIRGQTVKNISYERNPDFAKKECTKASFVIGMRYHSLVFSLNANVPCISISYSSKHEDIMNRMELSELSIRFGFSKHGYFEEINRLNSEQLVDTFFFMEKNEITIKETIAHNLPILRNAAQQNKIMLSNLLESPATTLSKPKD